jgi:hypothetical protein
MEYTPLQKRQYIQSLGRNPDEWDLDESFTRWVPAAKPQPSIADTTGITPPKQEQTTALETFGKTALTEAVPTAASFAAGVGLPALYGSAFGPAGTVGGLALGLVGAIGGNVIGRKLQEPFIPQHLQESVEVGRQEHPVASALGGFAPATLAFNPLKSIGQLPSLASAATRGLRGGALANREIAGLQNLGVNVGTGAGMAGYNELADDEEGFDIGRFALQTGLGGLLNEPTKLGRKVFRFKGTEDVPSNHIPGVVEKMGADYQARLTKEKAVKAALDRREADRLAAQNQARINNPEMDFNPQKSKTIPNEQERFRTMKDRYQTDDPDALDPNITRLYGDEPGLVKPSQQLAKQRGVNLNEQATLAERGPTGRLARGFYNREGRLASVSKERATPDTIAHETTHGYVDDLAESNIKGDREFRERIIQAAGGEENLAQRTGEELAQRIRQELTGKGKASTYFKDFLRNVKMKLGVASDEEAIKFLAQRMKYDAAFGSRREFLGKDVLAKATDYRQGAAQVLRPEGDKGEQESPDKFQPELRNYDPNWRVTVQGDQKLEDGSTMPSGYVQVDFVENGKNTRSTNINALSEEGYAMPFTEAEAKSLPTGQYTMEEAFQKIKDGKKFQEDEVPIEQRIRDLGSPLTKYKTHVIAPESGGIEGILDQLPAKEVMALLDKVGNKTADRIKVIQENTFVDGEKQDYSIREGETFRQWRKRLDVSFENLDTTPRAEDPNSGLMLRTGPDLGQRLYKHIGYDLKNYEFIDKTKFQEDAPEGYEVKETQTRPVPPKLKEDKLFSRKNMIRNRFREHGLEIDKDGRILYHDEKGRYVIDKEELPRELGELYKEFGEINRFIYKQDPPAKEGESFFAFQEDLPEGYEVKEFQKRPVAKLKGGEIWDEHEKLSSLLSENGVRVDRGTGRIFGEITNKPNNTLENLNKFSVKPNAVERYEGKSWIEIDPKKIDGEHLEVIRRQAELGRIIYGDDPPEVEGESAHAFQEDNPKREDVKPEHRRFGFFRFMESAIDKVRHLPTKVADEVADQSERFFARRDNLNGEYRGLPSTLLAESGATDAEMVEAYNYMRAKARKEPIEDSQFSEKSREIAEEILKPTWRQIRDAEAKEGIEVFDEKSGKMVAAEPSEYHAPDVLSDEAMSLFTKDSVTPEAKQAREEWARHVEAESGGEITYEEALKNIKEYTRVFGGNKLHNVSFRALQQAQRYGIPESLRETNLLKVVSKYGRRAAQNISFRKELQDNPRVAAALKLPHAGEKPKDIDVDDISSTPEAQNLLKFIFNDWEHTKNPKTMAATRTVVSGLLGLPTGIRNTVATIANVAPYLSGTKDVVGMVKALGQLSAERLNSIRTGARSGTMDLDRWMTMESPDKTTETFNKMSEVLRKYQGRDLLENFDRLYSFAIGKELAKNAIARGDEAWLKKFGTLVDKNIDEIGEADLNQIAKNFVDRVQGTYDARGLPAGAFEGPLAPFLALSRWSVEKSNVIYKDVVTPALTGENFKPLLTYTLGSLLTGSAIRELNELMSGKRAADASLDEAVSEENKSHAVAAVISLAQLGGYAGIMSDVAKGITDLAVSHEKPRGLAFPLVDFASDTVGQGIKDYITSVEAGAQPMDAAKDLILDIMKSSIQNVRVLNSRVIDSEGSERINRFRDARVFKKLQGEEVPSMDSFKNAEKYGEDSLKDFKRTSDMQVAASKLPTLISQAIEKASGDPYKLKAELRRIKQNNYQTLPNPTNMPISFLGMISFLQKTQGADAASERLMDYIKQNAVNKAKASLVP